MKPWRLLAVLGLLRVALRPLDEHRRQHELRVQGLRSRRHEARLQIRPHKKSLPPSYAGATPKTEPNLVCDVGTCPDVGSLHPDNLSKPRWQTMAGQCRVTAVQPTMGPRNRLSAGSPSNRPTTECRPTDRPAIPDEPSARQPPDPPTIRASALPIDRLSIRPTHRPADRLAYCALPCHRPAFRTPPIRNRSCVAVHVPLTRSSCARACSPGLRRPTSDGDGPAPPPPQVAQPEVHARRACPDCSECLGGVWNPNAGPFSRNACCC